MNEFYKNLFSLLLDTFGSTTGYKEITAAFIRMVEAIEAPSTNTKENNGYISRRITEEEKADLATRYP